MIAVEPKITYIVGDDLIAGVVAAAIWSEKRRFGLSQDMLRALNRGAAKTEQGTTSAFLFRAMVDRLLEEYHTLEAEKQEPSKQHGE